MSLDDAKEFLRRTSEDPDFALAVRQASRTALIAYAASRGLHFSAEDVELALAEQTGGPGTDARAVRGLDLLEHQQLGKAFTWC